ncbi:hypothetical protein K501DRAFT_242906 [Backusella circina FSU 941]|nr:hypothetical protein K501DRAFT_242906 [Backusella circina FSU 941]
MSDKTDAKRRPKNAAPIPVSNKRYNDYGFATSPKSFVSSDLPLASPSVFSEIDVVLDDGTLQKRTVSLSTIPDHYFDEEYQDESSHDTMDASAPLLKNNTTSSKNKNYNSIPYDEEGSGSPTSNESDSDGSFFSSPKQHYKPVNATPNRISILSRIRSYVSYMELSPQQRVVLKCSFAYCLGSLFTFIPALNALIGHNHVSSHYVATATVFFNPAKTLGAMMEASLYGWGYAIFALVICLGSMLTTDFLFDQNMLLTAHVLSLGFWLAGSTFIVAFLKAHWNKPPVATASSLCFIILFVILVREGSSNRGDFDTTRIEQIVSAVAAGTLITVTCCILFWPVSASKKLKKDLEATLLSYKVLLKLLTKTFLLDDDLPEFKANKTLQNAIDSHRASFINLQKSLNEAKFEAVWNSDIRGCTGEYDAIVKSMERLAQSVGGLKSSCGLQFELLNQDQQASGKRRLLKNAIKDEKEIWSITADHHRRKLEDELKRQRSMRQYSSNSTDSTPDEPEDSTLIEFIKSIQQPLKSLAYTCKQTIVHLKKEFSDKPRTGPNNETLKNNLVKAIALFEVSKGQAVERLNRCRKHHHDYIPKEDAFLVYFFVFNIIEFAQELMCLVEAVQALAEAKEKKHGFFEFIFQSFSKKRAKSSKASSFVPNERNTFNTLHTPIPKTKWRQLVLRVWRTFSLFKLQKVRYATKACVATVILATPAFLKSTGDWFREWRMEWALITLMVVMTPTLGQTNLVAIYRIFSTILGCFVAATLYLLFPDNTYVLIFCTWLFSIPNFWIILHHKHGKFGQFTLLAYNLVMLNMFNDRETHAINVTHLALQRCLSILVGVVFGLFVTAYIWPYEARVELRKGVSDFLLRLAWLYQSLVSFYSKRPKGQTEAALQRQQSSQFFMDYELQLQRTLLELQELLNQTPNEPRLKGAFPVATYRSILASCQNITDKFSTMRSVILKDEWFEQVQDDFIMPVSQERKEMVGNVLLYLYTLASALRLKTPLPPYLPPARQAWESLISRLRQLPVVKSKELVQKDHIYLFYYAYVTVLDDIIRELDKLGGNMAHLFGVIVPEEQWESLFNMLDIEQNQPLLKSI